MRGYEDALESALGSRKICTDFPTRFVYGGDASLHHSMPDVVAFADCTSDVCEILRIAHEYGVPVVPRGAGTSLSGQTVPVKGGIVIDTMRMNEVYDIHTSDLYCTVGPGIIYSHLNDKLAKHCFFFAPEPGSGDVCSIGGMVGNNASGIRTLKYGAMRDLVIGMEVVLPGGKLIEVGGKTLKNSSGYPLEKLFVGSEGTLGVFTRVRLRIHPLPECRNIVMSSFESLRNLSNAIPQIFSHGSKPSSVEIIDRRCIDGIRKKYPDFPCAEAVLMVEADGHPAYVRDEIKKISEILSGNGGKCDIITTDDEIKRVWSARKAVLPSMARTGKLHSVPLCDDVCLPVSSITHFISHLRTVEEETGVIIGAYGHVGEGNLHLKVLIDPLDRNHWEKAALASDRIYMHAIDLGGGVSAEHGVGMTKGKYFRWERGKLIAYMKKIKDAMDPKGIMNPGKIFESSDDIFHINRYFWDADVRFKEIERDILTCAMCGYCKHACPFYENNELFSPRGRMLILMGIKGKRVKISEENIKNLYLCTLCNRCGEKCSSSLEIADVLRSARRLLGIASHNEIYKRFTDNILTSGNIYGIDAPSNFLLKSKKEGKILYFAGCISSYAEVKIASSSMELLKRADMDIFTVNEICCGYPLYLLGRKFEEYSKKFKEFIASIECEKIIVSCDGCYRVMKHIHKLNKDVMHISEVISEKNLKHDSTERIFLHASCDLSRHTSLFHQVKNIVSSISGCAIVDECCGGGGCVRVGYEGLSIDVARKIVSDMEGTFLVTCPSCYQLFSFASNPSKLRVVHFADYILRRLENYEEQ